MMRVSSAMGFCVGYPDECLAVLHELRKLTDYTPDGDLVTEMIGTEPSGSAAGTG